MHRVGFIIRILLTLLNTALFPCSFQIPVSHIVLHIFVPYIDLQSVLVGPCHHGMARPQFADRGTASDKEGSCD